MNLKSIVKDLEYYIIIVSDMVNNENHYSPKQQIKALFNPTYYKFLMDVMDDNTKIHFFSSVQEALKRYTDDFINNNVSNIETKIFMKDNNPILEICWHEDDLVHKIGFINYNENKFYYYGISEEIEIKNEIDLIQKSNEALVEELKTLINKYDYSQNTVMLIPLIVFKKHFMKKFNRLASVINEEIDANKAKIQELLVRKNEILDKNSVYLNIVLELSKLIYIHLGYSTDEFCEEEKGEEEEIEKTLELD